jgi:arsenate reductase
MSPAEPVVYGIANCDTVKKARALLGAHGRAHRFHDFKKAGVPTAALQAWVEAFGWARLLNRQGSTWRKLDPQAQASAADAAGAMALMQAHPSVIRRPVLELAGVPLQLGFDAAAWGAALGIAAAEPKP